ncbi:MAG: sulfite exporter TauE/SafE family protein [Caldilineaceae bacterium]|nr:sulfite exporter TauE/SafE family protein [Caldilineaceae bacterium]
MIEQLLINLLLGFGIGLSLGLLGGGGSILTVPALVYVVGQTPQAAVTASLMIVGANSMMGAFMHRSQGTLNWRVALIFGGSGMAAAYLAAGWSALLQPTTLMILFALLMLIVGLFMVFRPQPSNEDGHGRGWLVTVASGLGVGILTGFLGVGGGFLIVPALVMLVGLPIRQAIGTSLVVIAMNSLAGFLGHLHDPAIDLQVVTVFVAAGLTGALTGARLARLVHPEYLRKAFALFVIALALVLLADNFHKMGWI